MSLPQIQSELPLRARRELEQDIVDMVYAGLCAAGPAGMTGYELSRNVFRHQLRNTYVTPHCKGWKWRAKFRVKWCTGAIAESTVMTAAENLRRHGL